MYKSIYLRGIRSLFFKQLIYNKSQLTTVLSLLRIIISICIFYKLYNPRILFRLDFKIY